MIFAILNPAAIFEEEHRLHILRLLIHGGEIVGERIVGKERLYAHVSPCVLPPQLFPCGGKLCLGVVAGVAELEDVVKFVRNFAPHSEVFLKLVIIHHTLKILSPCRICLLAEVEFGDPRRLGFDRGHHIINRADPHEPVHRIVGDKFKTAYRVEDIAGDNPLAAYLLH